MPSNKILTVLIICAGLVVSIWLFSRKPVEIKNNKDTISVEKSALTNATNTDWKKLIENISPSEQKITNLTSADGETVDNSTLTGQLAKDFLSQYLLVAKNGQTVSTQDASQIVQNTLSVSDYTEAKSPVYIASNLHINPKSDVETVKLYKETLMKTLNSRMVKVKNAGTSTDPATIVSQAITDDTPEKLSELDSFINTSRGIITDLLATEVPKDAVSYHLALLNSYSGFLSSLVSMKQVFVDPVRGFAGMSQFNSSLSAYQIAISNLNTYFKNKLGE